MFALITYINDKIIKIEKSEIDRIMSFLPMLENIKPWDFLVQ